MTLWPHRFATFLLPWLRHSLSPFLLLLSLFLSTSFAFGDEDVNGQIRALGSASFSQAETIVENLGKSGNAKLVPLLEALASGDLAQRKSDGAVFITNANGDMLSLIDPLSGAMIGTQAKGQMVKIRVNNSLRRAIRAAEGTLTLMSPDRGARLEAANTILKAPNADSLELLEKALAVESDGEVKSVLTQARAVALISSDRPLEIKRQAVVDIESMGGQQGLAVLQMARAKADPVLMGDIDKAVSRIQEKLKLWEIVQNMTYGLSLGSVLLLAAIGLAITFGVMGIINMAHGEMVMLGAYSTFVMQSFLRQHAPALSEWSLAFALPFAFVVTACAGLLIERCVIRFLYGRPLETLLATWGISLMLQQLVRSVFGPTNQEVANPQWMSGSFNLAGLAITWNRMWILIFALGVFTGLLFLLKRTSFGLQMRAVTQNRRMASSMGIRTPLVDAFTFALGSGIAGIAGVALSQIDNVSPNLGQSYIIDSFMVVVFGGVGNLWGTLVGAFSLGILNKLLEPFAGAVLGKILVLVLIILFIQKKPRGLFALKGRAVDA